MTDTTVTATVTASSAYDCSRLLWHVDQLEADYALPGSSAALSFGHPDPPQLHLLAHSLGNNNSGDTYSDQQQDEEENDGTVLVAVAYTKHCISAQLLYDNNNKEDSSVAELQEPLHICSLTALPQAEDSGYLVGDESITCLVVVALEEDDDNNDNDMEQHQEKLSEKNLVLLKRGKDSSILLQGLLSGPSSSLQIAVVFGTSASHLFSVELTVDFQKRTLQKTNTASAAGEGEWPSLFEVLPLMDRHPAAVERTPLFPFRPSGGVSSLTMFRDSGSTSRASSTSSSTTTHLWIVYQDGTVIRLHHAGVFPSIWKQGAQQGLSLDQVLGVDDGCLLRSHVCLPPDAVDARVVPLPRHYPSLLTPASVMNGTTREQQQQQPLEAIVYGAQSSSDEFPALVFYSSEVQFMDRDEFESSLATAAASAVNKEAGESKVRAVVGGTKKLVGGMVGSAMGALRWGMYGNSNTGGTTAASAVNDEATTAQDTATEPNEPASCPFPSLWSRPVELFAGHEYHDPPRQLELCTVDPNGMYAAATDNLGRVLLFDLKTKQLIRMWKGYREARCYWVLQKRQTAAAKRGLYLVIHSRHRHIVESWRVHHDQRLNLIQISRDAQIVPCTRWSHQRTELSSSCYLAHSLVPGTNENLLELVKMVGEDRSIAASDFDMPEKGGNLATRTAPASTRAAALRLQHLQQLLSTSNAEFSTQDVYKALKEIQLGDLATALDLIGGTTVLEDKLKASGAQFHGVALSYCQHRLKDAVAVGGSDTASNPHIRTLSNKIKYHSQIVKAFEVLSKFQLGEVESTKSKKKSTPSSWAAEAMGWVSTHEHVTKSPLEAVVSNKDRMRFSHLFNSCVFPTNSSERSSGVALPIYLSDSSRTRRDILVHVFQPLLGDIFSLNVVFTVFDALGIRDDTDYILRCFGEWFMLLSKEDIYGSMLASNPPLTRYLRDLVNRQLSDKGRNGNKIALETLHTHCTKATDLVRAFMLSVLSREAVARASVQREKVSYGKIKSRPLVEAWDTLLRKLRVCLLVSLRLTARVQAPISVDHVEQGDMFSVYEWVALDELSMSHDQEEIALLEKACAISSHSFDPSTSDGDGPAKFKSLQNSCVASQISEEERAEYLVDFDDEDRFGALLLFLKSHNEPSILAAHRALLLCSEWTKEPKDIKCLHDSYMALDALYSTSNNTLTAAVCLDIWKLCAVVFRAHLFGWDDVQEISESSYAPLLEEKDWLVSFGRVALKFLRILRAIEFELDAADELTPKTVSDDATWPLPKPDFMLERLVSRLFRIKESSVDAHCVVICALLVSNDVGALVECVPAIYDCFLPSSLANTVPPAPHVAALQYKFVEDAIRARARACSNQILASFGLQEIETLAYVWTIDVKGVRSQFLLTMYELEKDKAVDDLLTKNPTEIDLRMFVEHGVDIACRRLAAFLNGERMHASSRRNVMGLLDADLCGWVLSRADEGQWLVDTEMSRIPIDKTNLFILRLLSLSAGANIDSSLRTKIHSLAKLSSTLLKELSGHKV